jgi:hypothetical protein
MSIDDRVRTLLDRRFPRDEVELGRAYVIHARNGGIGIAVTTEEKLGYRLHREKFGTHFLFDEWDWDEGEPFGTAIPLRRLDADPPSDDVELLEWLACREWEWRVEIDAAWRTRLRGAR